MPLLITSLAHWTARIVAVGLLLAAASAEAAAPALRWKLVAEYPHDEQRFTQGLLWHDGRLFESGGQYGASHVAETALATGIAVRTTALPTAQFGEGLALLGTSLWQLTWREGVLHRYDLALKPIGSLRYGGEGWGLASDGKALIISNGTATLSWLDPNEPRLLRTVEVRDGDTPIRNLNELEWVDGQLYANVWMTDRIARIDTTTGAVTGWLDLAPLKVSAGIGPLREAHGAVLNGIAWRRDKGHLLVTGKWWPKVFEIELLP